MDIWLVAAVRAAAAAFTTAVDLQSAMEERLGSGLAREALSVLAASDALRKKLGHSHYPTGDTADAAREV